MASTIQIKNSTTGGNSPSSLTQGEFAINVIDGNLFYGDGSSVKQDFAFGDITGSNAVLSGTLTLPGIADVSASIASIVGESGADWNTNLLNIPAGLVSGSSQVVLQNANKTGFTGASSITTLGTIGTGVWQGTAIADAYISSATTWNNKLDSSGTISTNDYAKFNASGDLIGRSYSEVKTDLSLNNVENTALSTYTGNGGALDNQYITNGAGYTTNTGTVTSVGGTGTVSGLSLSGTVTTSGNLTLGGTISISSTNITDVDAFSQSGTYASLRAQGTTKGDVGLGNVENTALSTWAGSSNLVTLGTVTSGDVSAILPAGTVSGSSQININSTTGDLTTLGTVTSGDVSAILPAGTVSGSSQIAIGSTTGTITSAKISDVDAFSQTGTYASLRAQGTTAGDVGLGNVENTALSTYTGNGGALDNQYITNGAGYTTNTGTVTSVGGTGTVSGLSLSGTVTTSGNLTLGGTISISSANITDVDAFSQSGTYASLRAQGTTAGDVGLGNVENTALSTWAGSSNITTLGTVTLGNINAILPTGTVSGSAQIDLGSATGTATNASTASYIAGSNVDGAVTLSSLATTAINATNTTNVDINNVSGDNEYGLVFRDGNGDGNQNLYADSEADQPSYNPSTNTITTPIISASSALYVGGDITVTGNVDGVDVSTLKSDFDTLENKTLVSGSSQITIGSTTGTITSAKISDVDAFSQSGTYASLRAQGTTAADVGLGNVENTALSTYTGNGGALDNQYITNGAGYTTNTGTVTNVTVGTGLDVTNGTTTPNITLDLTEITVGTGLDTTATGISLDLTEVGFAAGGVNRLITNDGDGTVTSETNLTFDGTTLNVDGQVDIDEARSSGAIVDINNTYSGVMSSTHYALKVTGGQANGTPGSAIKAYGGHFTAGDTNGTNPDTIALYAQGHEDGAPNSYAAIFSGSAGGVVGINTMEPTVELDVVGDGKFSGTLEIGGISDVSASIAAAGGGGGGAVATYTNGSNDRIITSTGTDGINGEANLTFTGTTLRVTGNQAFNPAAATRGIVTDIETNWESTSLVSSGEYIEVGASVSRTQHDLFNLSGSWSQANSGDVSTATGLLGVSPNATTGNEWLVKGVFNIAQTNLAGHPAEIGSPVYIGATNGKYTVTPPTSAGDVSRIVGHIADTYVSGRTTYYKIYFNPSSEWIEL